MSYSNQMTMLPVTQQQVESVSIELSTMASSLLDQALESLSQIEWSSLISFDQTQDPGVTPGVPETSSASKPSLFTSFSTSFLSILVCEIGDKTFFLAMIMAMKYNNFVVFLGAYGALAVMTVLSAVFGSILFSFLPKIYTDILVTLLFFYFGLKLIYEAYNDEGDENGQNEEKLEVEQELKEMEEKMVRKTNEERAFDPNYETQGELMANEYGSKGKPKVVLTDRVVLTQAFIMTFLAEWGDRSQIATIALAASYDLVMVNLGALLGHFICTMGAVQLGDWISKHVTERQVHIAGGIVFLLSGLVTFVMIFDNQ